jgi:hypothetical protein
MSPSRTRCEASCTTPWDVAERGQGAWALKDGARRRLITSDERRTIVVEGGKSKGARREHAAQFTAAAMRADRRPRLDDPLGFGRRQRHS